MAADFFLAFTSSKLFPMYFEKKFLSKHLYFIAASLHHPRVLQCK